MKKIVLLLLCLLLVWMTVVPCFAADNANGELTEEYGVGHADGHVEAAYGEGGAHVHDEGFSAGTMIAVVGVLLIAVCVAVLFIKKKH